MATEAQLQQAVTQFRNNAVEVQDKLTEAATAVTALESAEATPNADELYILLSGTGGQVLAAAEDFLDDLLTKLRV